MAEEIGSIIQQGLKQARDTIAEGARVVGEVATDILAGKPPVLFGSKKPAAQITETGPETMGPQEKKQLVDTGIVTQEQMYSTTSTFLHKPGHVFLYLKSISHPEIEIHPTSQSGFPDDENLRRVVRWFVEFTSVEYSGNPKDWKIRDIEWGKEGKGKEDVKYDMDTKLSDWCSGAPQRLIVGGDQDEIEMRFQC